MIKNLAIICHSPALQEKARLLSQQLQIPITESINQDYLLIVDELGLSLAAPKLNLKNALYLDFTAGKSQFRRLHGGGIQQALLKAIGIKNKSSCPTVIDATAGFGSDSFVLASHGCQVYAIERSAIIYTLLQDALNRASHHQEVAEIIQHIELHQGDASTLFHTLPKADVIYLDPMFPHSESSAQVKKEMQIIRALVGEDSDNESLLPHALSHAKKRVVVKRPKIAPFLNQQKPSFQLIGQSNRYDIYIIS